MKRTKLMVGVLALSAALLGTGYAAFKDQVVIGGTVSTANFCVQFTEEPKLQLPKGKTFDEYKTDNEITNLTANLTTPQSETDAKDLHKISFFVENLKPGVPVTYKTTIKNKSSIDAVLKQITVKNEKDGYPANGVDLKVKLGDVEVEGTLDTFGTAIGNWSTLQEDGNEGDNVDVEFTVTVVDEENATAEHNGNAGKEIKFDIVFDWEQVKGQAEGN